MKYDILLFDADNTLFDFTACEKEAFSETLRAQNVRETDGMLGIYSAYNDACWKALERGEIEKSDLVVRRWALFLGHFGLPGDAAEFNRVYLDCLSGEAILLDGAKELLAALSLRADVYIVTNGVARVQAGRFAASGIRRYIKEVFISEELGTKKPDALFFKRVAARIPGFSQERALVVGDSLTSDIRGANNAGLDCVWFARGEETPPPDLKITATVRNFEEMKSFILGEEA